MNIPKIRQSSVSFSCCPNIINKSKKKRKFFYQEFLSKIDKTIMKKIRSYLIQHQKQFMKQKQKRLKYQSQKPTIDEYRKRRPIVKFTLYEDLYLIRQCKDYPQMISKSSFFRYIASYLERNINYVEERVKKKLPNMTTQDLKYGIEHQLPFRFGFNRVFLPFQQRSKKMIKQQRVKANTGPKKFKKVQFSQEKSQIDEYSIEQDSQEYYSREIAKKLIKFQQVNFIDTQNQQALQQGKLSKQSLNDQKDDNNIEVKKQQNSFQREQDQQKTKQKSFELNEIQTSQNNIAQINEDTKNSNFGENQIIKIKLVKNQYFSLKETKDIAINTCIYSNCICQRESRFFPLLSSEQNQQEDQEFQSQINAVFSSQQSSFDQIQAVFSQDEQFQEIEKENNKLKLKLKQQQIQNQNQNQKKQFQKQCQNIQQKIFCNQKEKQATQQEQNMIQSKIQSLNKKQNFKIFKNRLKEIVFFVSKNQQQSKSSQKNITILDLKQLYSETQNKIINNL